MRMLVALALSLAAGSALAGYHSGPISPSPYDRPIPGLRDPLDVRDPLMQSAPANEPLPDLGSSGGSDWFRDERPRELPGTQFPLAIDPQGPRPETPGGPWYWQEQPLYIPSAP